MGMNTNKVARFKVFYMETFMPLLTMFLLMFAFTIMVLIKG